RDRRTNNTQLTRSQTDRRARNRTRRRCWRRSRTRNRSCRGHRHITRASEERKRRRRLRRYLRTQEIKQFLREVAIAAAEFYTPEHERGAFACFAGDRKRATKRSS